MAFGNFGVAVNVGDARALFEIGAIAAETHGAAEIASRLALLQLVSAEPFSHEADHRLRRRAEFGRVGFSQSGEGTGGLDDRHLHAEADAEVRHFALAREPRRQDLALGAARSEAAGHEDAVHPLEPWRRVSAL